MRIHFMIRAIFFPGGDRNTFVKTLEAQNFTLGEFKQKEMEKIIVGAMKRPERQNELGCFTH